MGCGELLSGLFGHELDTTCAYITLLTSALVYVLDETFRRTTRSASPSPLIATHIAFNDSPISREINSFCQQIHANLSHSTPYTWFFSCGLKRLSGAETTALRPVPAAHPLAVPHSADPPSPTPPTGERCSLGACFIVTLGYSG